MTSDATTVVNVLRRLRSRGAHPLLICDDDRISYADADRRSAALARRLIALGAGKGTHVGLLYPNGCEFLVGMLAAARIGAVVVPFSTFMTAPELRTQLAAGDVSILLSAREYRSHDYEQRLRDALGVRDLSIRLFTEHAPVLRRIVFDVDHLGAGGDEANLAAVEADVDGTDPLAIIYTSGSTGPPKGALHTHASLLDHQAGLNTIRGLGPQDRLFCNSPFFWIGGFAFGLLATFTAGATLLCSNATDAGRTLDLIETEKPTMTNGFLAGIEHLTRHPSYPGRRLSARRGNLYPLMAPDVRPADPALRHNMLGMTETGSVVLVSADDGDQPERRRGSYGKPAPGFDTRVIRTDTGTDADVGDVGELLLRGPYLMQRYHGRSREECFDADGWFHTGDLVRADADGFFYFVSRSGSMIKTAGANVTPVEVEQALTAVLTEMGHRVSVHVLGLPDAVRGQVVAAVVASDDVDTWFDETAVRHKLAEQLSAYKVPGVFATCTPAALPVLSSGKIDIPALAGLFDV